MFKKIEIWILYLVVPVFTASVNQVRSPIYKDSIENWKKYEEELRSEGFEI